VVEHLKSAAGIDVLMVPYTGGVPIVNALLTGEVSMTLMNVSLLADWVRQGKLRALATSQTKRLKLLPDVPTMAEAGFGDLHLGEGNSYIVAGPAGMPKPVVDRLHQAFTAALEKPEVRKRLEDLGYELRPQDGTVLKAELQQSLRDNEKAVKTLGIKLID
jgi:tripartite-type tricarboxylate transporter receptor subunit TctC